MIDARPIPATVEVHYADAHDATRAAEYPDRDHSHNGHREYARDECNDYAPDTDATIVHPCGGPQ